MSSHLIIHIYDSTAPASAQKFVEDLSDRPGLTGVLKTKLHGGFWDADISFDCAVEDAWDWILNRANYRVIVEDVANSTVWEGRLRYPRLRPGGVRLTFRGYWSVWLDRVIELGSTKSYTAQDLDAIIQDIRDNWTNASILSSSNTQFDNPAVTIDRKFVDKTAWQAIAGDQEGVANQTDSSNNQYFVAVWEGTRASSGAPGQPVVYFKQRSISAVDWQVLLADLKAPPAVGVDYDGIYNAVSVKYRDVDAADAETRTAVSQNTASQTSFGRRDLLIDGGYMDSAGATNRRDRALETLRVRRAAIDGGITIKRLHDRLGVEQVSLARLRAGDVLRISDLVPNSAGLSGVSLDAFRTFFVRETEYRWPENVITAYLDQENQSLERLLAPLVKRTTI